MDSIIGAWRCTTYLCKKLFHFKPTAIVKSQDFFPFFFRGMETGAAQVEKLLLSTIFLYILAQYFLDCDP